MAKMIRVFCENNQSTHYFPLGTSLSEMALQSEIAPDNQTILGAMVNNEVHELSYEIYKPKNIFLLTYQHSYGKQMYIRSLTMVLYKAIKDSFPLLRLKVEHSISKGLYCELTGPAMDKDMHREVVMQIKHRMQEIIQEDYPITRDEVETSEAIQIFKDLGLNDKVKLLSSRTHLYSSVYQLDDIRDYYYGPLVPSTGFLKVFDLIPYYHGMLLIFPKTENPMELEDIVIQPKMFEIFQEHKDWVEILEVPTVGELNAMVESKKISELIKVAEALQEKKLASIADQIHEHKHPIRAIFVSGPSSSGKTTFTKRLAIQLRVLGYRPLQISLDNYFVEREKTPRDEHGEYDFETPDALDIRLFSNQMRDLLDGKPVIMPRFSFTNGSRYFVDKELQMEERSILIIEGIHALNPLLSDFIDSREQFKVYVSAFTQLNLDLHNRIPTTDNRLIRRMVRDSLYRGYSALDTLSRWPSVRRGEDRYIFPFQEQADVMFNTALIFELSVLKWYAQPLLEQVPRNVSVYAEAKRLMKFLSYFQAIPDHDIPATSILREFLEGSSFEY